MGPVDADPIAWSPDGTKLLLLPRSPEPPEDQIYGDMFVLHADGSRTRPLPKLDPNSFPRWRPPTWGSFSPDGTEVTYATNGGSRGPYIIDVDGGKPRPLGRPCPKISGNLELCGEPFHEAAAWSPDGLQIAWLDFVEDSAQYGHHAFVLSFVNPDGTGLREEVAPMRGQPTFGGVSLVWSPDGSRLARGHRRPDLRHQRRPIGLRQVTRDGNNTWPAWSPDGSRIAFVHNGTLSIMAPDGTDMESVQA